MILLHPLYLERPIAHRALHGMGRPENSIEAIEVACDANYGIEIDLQLSSDGVAMVFHDYDLRRLSAGIGAVRQHTAVELHRTRLKGASSGIPTLTEVLDRVDGRVPLLIELKDQDGGLGPNIGELEEATAKALEGYTGLTALMSFNPHSVIRMCDLCPNIPRGLTTCAFTKEDWPLVREERLAELRPIPDIEAADASFISHDRKDLDNPRVAELKAQGLNILTWTIHNATEEAEARRVAENVTFEHYLPA